MTGGTVTLALDGPAAGTIPRNEANQTLMKFKTTSEPNITIKGLKVNVQMKDASGTTIVVGTDANWALVKNLKVEKHKKK